MGKGFRGKRCVYCQIADSDTGDHVFSRQFFAVGDRANLPKVPACDACNTRKSSLEQYILATLPMGGTDPASQAHHLEKLPRRLSVNPRLHATVVEQASEHWLRRDSGFYERRMAFPLDSDKFEALFQMIARALVWYHWSTFLSEDAHFSIHLPYPEAEHVFSDALLTGPGWERVSASLGSGTIEYAGWQAIDTPDCTFWRIRLFGGVLIGGGDSPAERTSSVVGIITAPVEYERRRLGA